MLESAVGSRSGVSKVFRWQSEAARIPRCVGFCSGLSSRSTRPLLDIRIASTSFDEIQDKRTTTSYYLVIIREVIINQSFLQVVYDNRGIILLTKRVFAPLSAELAFT